MSVKKGLFLLCSFLFSTHIHSQIRFNHRLKPRDVVKWFKLVAPPDPGCTSTPDTLITIGRKQSINHQRASMRTASDWFVSNGKGCYIYKRRENFFRSLEGYPYLPITNQLQPGTRLPLELKEGRDSISAPKNVLIVGFRTWTIGPDDKFSK